MTYAAPRSLVASASDPGDGAGGVMPRRAVPRHRRRRYFSPTRWNAWATRVCRFPRPRDVFAPAVECRRCGGAITWVRAYTLPTGDPIRGRWRHLPTRRRATIVIGSGSPR